MPIGRLVQRFRRRRIVDKTVRYGWFPGHCKPSSRSLFVCKSPGNFLVIRVFVYVVHPAFLWVILGLACRGVCVGCTQHRFSRRPSLRPSLVFRSHASHPSPSCMASVLRSRFLLVFSFRVLLLSFVFSPLRFVYAFVKHLVFRVIHPGAKPKLLTNRTGQKKASGNNRTLAC